MWGRYRLAASAMCGPHPVLLDVRCSTCRAGVGEQCTAKRTELHCARADRYLAAHERWVLLTLNLADAAFDQANARSPRAALRLAARRADELARVMRPAGLTYRVPAPDDVLAAATTIRLFPAHQRASLSRPVAVVTWFFQARCTP
jgi:hypothetical protein